MAFSVVMITAGLIATVCGGVLAGAQWSNYQACTNVVVSTCVQACQAYQSAFWIGVVIAAPGFIVLLAGIVLAAFS